jgi:hypothetical protein
VIGSGKGQGGDGEDPCSCDGLQKVTRVFERLERVQLLSRDPNSSCMSHLCWHLRTESRIRWHHFGGEITYACALRDCVETNGLPTVQWHPDVAPCCPPQEVDFVVFTMKAPKHLRCGHLPYKMPVHQALLALRNNKALRQRKEQAAGASRKKV